MKNLILDSPFLETSKYSFEDILKEDEIILWKGQPKTGALLSLLDYLAIGVLISLMLYLWFSSSDIIGLPFILGIIYGSSIFERYARRNTMRETNYGITKERILWSFEAYQGRKSHSINFDNIKWAEIEDNAIFIRPKNYELVSFETQSAKDLNPRNKPTLENIENIAEVYELIEDQLNESNSK